jgi:hypothetical protein
MTSESVFKIVLTIFASTGFWTLINNIIDRKSKRKNADTKLLLGLAHDRICYLAEVYIKRGYITKDEYENLNDYLFIPYEERGGNGTAAKLMAEVRKLPMYNKED